MAGMIKALVASAVLVASIPAGAQEPPGATFDAVSIKADVSDDPRQSLGGTSGRMIGENVPAWWLIRAAFQIQEFQIVGAPDWVFSDRFDVLATMPADTAPGEVRIMLRAMLADRFGLATRDDTREVPSYALAAEAGRPKITRATSDCEAVAGTAERCGINVNNGRIRGRSVPLAELARLLQQFVRRPVLDKTELGGRFDFELRFTPELSAGGGADDVSLFTALREQLGLNLQPDRAAVRVLVVERVARPTSD